LADVLSIRLPIIETKSLEKIGSLLFFERAA